MDGEEDPDFAPVTTEAVIAAGAEVAELGLVAGSKTAAVVERMFAVVVTDVVAEKEGVAAVPIWVAM